MVVVFQPKLPHAGKTTRCPSCTFADKFLINWILNAARRVALLHRTLLAYGTAADAATTPLDLSSKHLHHSHHTTLPKRYLRPFPIPCTV